jgi:3-oxoacyl-[acyl-carrier protein] reductase
VPSAVRRSPGTTAIGAAFGAIENFTRNLAVDVSPHGVRVVCVRTAAMPETRTIRETRDFMVKALNLSDEQVLGALANLTLLKLRQRSPTPLARLPSSLPTTRA